VDRDRVASEQVVSRMDYLLMLFFPTKCIINYYKFFARIRSVHVASGPRLGWRGVGAFIDFT